MILRFQPSLVCLGVFLCLAACTKPKERQHVDEHLKAAFDLAGSDPERALVELEKVKEARGEQIAYVRGLALEEQKKFTEAEKAFSEAVRLDPKGLMPLTALARTQLLQGKKGEALENLRKVVRKDPGSLPAILLLVVAQDTEETRKEARRALLDWQVARPKVEAQAPLRAEYFLALASVENGPTQRAEAEVEASKAKIGSIDAAITLARFALHQGKLGLAAGLADRLARADAEPEQLEAIAALALDANVLSAAEHALGRVPLNERSPSLLLLRGRVELTQGHPKRALAHLVAALGAAKQDDLRLRDQIEYFAAQANFADGNSEEARAVLGRLLEHSPEHRASHLLLSEIDLSEGRSKEALARLQQLLEKYPKDAALLVSLGKAKLRAKDFRGAEETFRSCVEVYPDDPSLIYPLVEALKGQGKKKEALSTLQDALEADPSNLALLRALVNEHVGAKNHEGALSVIHEALGDSKDEVGVKLLLADTLDTLGRHEELEKVLLELTKQKPDSPRAWSAWARVQGRKKDLEGMERSLRRVLSLQPQALKDKARLATVLQELGKKKEAAQLFGELADELPRDLVALNNAAMLYAVELNEPIRAVEYAERAHQLAPENAAVMDTLGWALLARGKKADLERAVLLLERASRVLKSPITKYHHGAALLRAGREEEGKRVLTQALEGKGEEPWRKDARALLSGETGAGK